jgi:hypothetical protein
MHAAQTLGSFDFGEPEVEVEVAVSEEGELDLSDFVMEEDMEMCTTAEIPVSGPSTALNSTFNKGLSQPCLLSLVYKLPM